MKTLETGCFSRFLRPGFRRSKYVPSEVPSALSPDGTLPEKDRRHLAPADTSTIATQSCICCATPTEVAESTLATLRHNRSGSQLLEEYELFKPDVLQTIETEITRLEPELHKLSDDIWSHPETAYEERYAHDRLSKFVSERGFDVTPHYLDLPTAWRAEYSLGLGHACGHNLIAVSGVAIALSLRAALDKHNIPGTIVLLGTPAEETGGGKIQLLDRGAFKKIDACLMAHPAPGPLHSTWISPYLSCQHIEVEFFGHSAHAAFAPWEAQNALDAAFLAYSGVSVLRQQIKPACRVHGVVSGKDWEPNVIPDYAKMRWIVRAPTWAEIQKLRTRIINCFEAAALATSCKIKVKTFDAYYDVRENGPLGEDFLRVVASRYRMGTMMLQEAAAASTDFGNISYAIPSVQAAFTIPTKPKGANHTPQFAESARLPESFDATMTTSKGLAMTGFRVLADDNFYLRVKQSYEAQKALDDIASESS